MLAWVASFFVNAILGFIPIVGWLVGMAILLGLVVLWVMGLIAAANGQMKPVPFVGPYFEKWFGRAFE